MPEAVATADVHTHVGALPAAPACHAPVAATHPSNLRGTIDRIRLSGVLNFGNQFRLFVFVCVYA